MFVGWVLTVLTSSIKYNEYVTDKGKNISIPCIADGNTMWVKENGNNSTIVQAGKYLVLTNVTASDKGVYVCFAAVLPSRLGDDNDFSIQTRESEKLANVMAHDDESQTTTAISRIETTPSNDSFELSSVHINADSNNHNINASTTSMLPMPQINASLTATARTSTNAILRTSSSNDTSNQNIIISDTSNNRSSNNFSLTTTTTTPSEVIEQEFRAFQKVNLTVRTPPGPVTQLYFKASTILGFLVWRFNKSDSGGYPVRSFTAEYRNVSYKEPPFNNSFEHQWSRMDPINIAPNVRQMEVYRLEPNTTYEFRIWANNQLGSGEVVTTNVTTLPETKEEDLIRLIQPDLDNFDPRIWIVAVSIVLGTCVILAIGLCIVLSKECYQSSQAEYEDGWDSIELIPNIILNPGFCEADNQREAPFTRTIIFGEDDDSDDSCESESDHEPRMEKFKRKLSVFFTDPTIKRI
uniref:Fibronectin type-III domain-containing protein n=1 Tax=Glossina morsitans morsitans TaxID=37546 RepID=A0A1B0FQ10_GLOMM